MWPVGQQTLLRRFARGVTLDLQVSLKSKRVLRRNWLHCFRWRSVPYCPLIPP